MSNLSNTPGFGGGAVRGHAGGAPAQSQTEMLFELGVYLGQETWSQF